MFTPTQRDAVREAFERAGFGGPIGTAPVSSEDERVFLVDDLDYFGLDDVGSLEAQLQAILGRKTWVVERTLEWDDPVPFQ